MAISKFNVMVYNVFLACPEIIRSYGQGIRAAKIHEVIRNVESQMKDVLDVIVLLEVMNTTVYDVIVPQMASLGFTYKTERMQDHLTVDGGVLIFSRHPITQANFSLYGSICAGSDCLSAKGISFARIKRNESEYFNVFATHTQSWADEESQEIRKAQTEYMKQFITSKTIPINEPVFLVGDLNIDLYTNHSQIQNLLSTLNLELPDLADGSFPYSFDPINNTLVGSDNPTAYSNNEHPNGCVEEYYKTLSCPCCASELLDYVLYSKDHFLPTMSEMMVYPVKVKPFKMMISATQEVEIQDVSDHFPVVGSFTFSKMNDVAITKAMDQIDTSTVNVNGNTGFTVFISLLIAFGIIAILVAIVLLVSYKRSRKRVTFASSPRNVLSSNANDNNVTSN